MSINNVSITGNLTRDPELRSKAGGTAVMSFGIAVNDYRKNQQTGEWEDCPNFIDCIMFGARAQSVSRFLSKGSKVAIEGKLRWSQWERDGQKRSKIEVIVNDIEFMSRQQGQLGSEPVYAAAAPAQSMQPMQQQFGGMPAPQQAAPSIYNDDIPF